MLLSPKIKVSGCSGKVLSISTSNLAGIATAPSLSDSIVMLALIVVSRSDATTRSVLLFISNKKLSNIGNVLLLLITPIRI